MVTVPAPNSFLNVLATTPLYSGVGLTGSYASSAEITGLLSRLDEQGDRDSPVHDSISILKSAGRVNGSDSYDNFLKALGLQLDGMSGKDRMAVRIAAATTLIRGDFSSFDLRKREAIEQASTVLKLTEKGKASLLGIVGENVARMIAESGAGLLELGKISSDLVQAKKAESPHIKFRFDLAHPIKSWSGFWATFNFYRGTGFYRDKSYQRAASHYEKAASNWERAGEPWTAAEIFLSAEECYRLILANGASDNGFEWRSLAQRALDRGVACYLQEGFYAHAAYAHLRRNRNGQAAMIALQLVEENGHDRIDPDVVCSLARRAILSNDDNLTEARLFSLMQASFAFGLQLHKLHFLAALHFLDAAANANKAGDPRQADSALSSALHIAISEPDSLEA